MPSRLTTVCFIISISSITERLLKVWKTNEVIQMIAIGETGGLKDAHLIYLVYNILFGSNIPNDQNK